MKDGRIKTVGQDIDGLFIKEIFAEKIALAMDAEKQWSMYQKP